MTSPYGRPPRSASTSHSKSTSPGPALGISRSFHSSGSQGTDNYDFQMMDITVGVDIMEGLVMEITKQKSEPPLGLCPVTAVISCKKNVSSSRQISTHVPSLPLAVPSASFGDKVHNFLVRWPADFDPHGDALSTFKMSRLMKKDTFNLKEARLTSGFVAEEIELTIGLMRGKDMLTLGKASLIITGNETDEMVIDLPISNEKAVVKDKKRDSSPSPLKRTNSKLFSKSTKSTVKVLKPLSFPTDKRRKFNLTDNAMIRLQVKVHPMAGNGSSGSEFGVQSSVLNTPSYTTRSASAFSKNSRVSSGSFSHKPSKETASTEYITSAEYSSREESGTFFASQSNDESLGSSDSYVDNSQSYTNRYPIQPHKYHPHIPMDELQEDFGRVRLTELQRRAEVSNSRGMTPPHMPPTRTRPSSNGRAFGSEMPRYTQKDMQSPQIAVRLSSRSRGANSRHSSGTPRSTTPQQARHVNPHEGYYQPRSSSRTRDIGHHQIRQNHYSPQLKPYPVSHGSNRDLVPRGSYDYHSQEPENVRPYHTERRPQRPASKEKMNRHPGDSGEGTESPMTWLYDKFVGGKVPSAEETVSTRKKANTKTILSPEYRRPSAKRTMRV
jgi:hypothetical protein